jgi:thiosulfate dehydrogenase [quinone] large subunit
MQAPAKYTNFQATALVVLRIFIGWHFFYEGLSKLFNSYWTSAGYLAQSQGLFKGIFHNIAASPAMLTFVDHFNTWALILIGLGLMAGLLTRVSAIGAIVLLALYYVAVPPFVGLEYSMPMEGSYVIVNKVLIELAAVVVLLAFRAGEIFGLDPWIARKRNPAGVGAAQANA